MAIKITESALKRRVGRVSGNTGIFLGLNVIKFLYDALIRSGWAYWVYVAVRSSQCDN